MVLKILIIRFSSIGDIIQCLSVITGLKNKFPTSEIHWITRKDMSSFLAMDNRIEKVWAFDKNKGLKELVEMAQVLKKLQFDYVYDAHNNIRSHIVRTCIIPFGKRFLGFGPPHFSYRSKQRWKRFLLFKLKIDKFPMPFRGMESFQKPLAKWGVVDFSVQKRNWFFPEEIQNRLYRIIFKEFCKNYKKLITIVPSAAYELKRWPIFHWINLIKLLPDYQFIILAGPTDHFTETIRRSSPNQILNLAGKTNLLESCYVISQSNIVLSADTGFLHAADLFSIKGISIMGPTAFGFTTGPSIKTLEIDLPCRPCTKDGSGNCSQDIHQKCLVNISPEWVSSEIKLLLK